MFPLQLALVYVYRRAGTNRVPENQREGHRHQRTVAHIELENENAEIFRRSRPADETEKRPLR